jgi:hypothetical protein
MSGYVRLYRSLIEKHPAFRNDAEAMAFAWLVAKAQWQPAKLRYKERILFLDRGQAAISVRDFARAMDRDKAWIERLLKRLKAEAMVTTRTETGVNVVTICNYNEYQPQKISSETADETPNETGARQGRDTEQVREEREEGNSEAIASVPARLPISEAVEFWNKNAATAGWPTVAKLNEGRRRDLRNRLREHGLDGWKAAIIRARASPFLGGADPPAWFNFDFLIHPRKFVKVIEGNYDRTHSDNADPTAVALARVQAAFGERPFG